MPTHIKYGTKITARVCGPEIAAHKLRHNMYTTNGEHYDLWTQRMYEEHNDYLFLITCFSFTSPQPKPLPTTPVQVGEYKIYRIRNWILWTYFTQTMRHRPPKRPLPTESKMFSIVAKNNKLDWYRFIAIPMYCWTLLFFLTVYLFACLWTCHHYIVCVTARVNKTDAGRKYTHKPNAECTLRYRE